MALRAVHYQGQVTAEYGGHEVPTPAMRYARGLLVPAIRPPMLARNSARLRITFSAGHTSAHVDRLLDGLASLR